MPSNKAVGLYGISGFFLKIAAAAISSSLTSIFNLRTFVQIVCAQHYCVGGAVASRLECSTPDRVVLVRVLAGDIVLCSWARHFTLTVPLSTQLYKWVLAKCWG